MCFTTFKNQILSIQYLIMSTREVGRGIQDDITGTVFDTSVSCGVWDKIKE
jgi:predicted enzyme involved in methoxymalonyl-ACP biosynthesis